MARDKKVIQFPRTISEYGDLFSAVMDVCGDVQFNEKDHLDATAEIMDIFEKYCKREIPLT